VTAVVPVKLVPVIVIAVPLAAVVGVKVERVGAGIKVKAAGSIAVSARFGRTTSPDAPAPTIAVTSVSAMMLNDAAGIPPKDTADVPPR
jgi:hypothetical protein